MNIQLINETRHLYHYLKPLRLLMALNLMLMIVMASVQGVGIGMLIPIMQSLSGGEEQNVFTDLVRWVFVLLGVTYSFNILTITLAGLTLLRIAIEALQNHYTRVLTSTFTTNLQKSMFDNLMNLPLAYYYKQKVGDLVATQFTSATSGGGVVDNLTGLIKAGFLIVIYFITGCLVSLKMTFLLILIGLASLVLLGAKSRAVQQRAYEQKKIIDRIHCYLNDVLSGIKTVKNYNNEDGHRKEYNDFVNQFRKYAISIMDGKVISALQLESFLSLTLIVALLVAVNIWDVSLAPLITVLFIFVQLVPQVKSMNKCILGIKEYMPHISKVHELIDTSDKHYLPDSLREFPQFERDIRLEHVSFRYNETEEYVLRDIDMVIKRGKTVALVGSSGAGKTTLADLIMRYHDPSEGRILIDGRVLKEEIGIASWRRQIGCVEQHPFIFNETIYANILYGRPDASREEVIKAATLAYAHDFIIALPRGYDAVVGDRGITLSGGQQQRIALARVLLKNPAILILDEATSALDSESERYIQLAMERLRMTRTLVIIAHRLSTIVNADEIFFLEGGRIIEAGNHEALIEYGGRYRSFYELQFGNPRKEAWTAS
ncbi:MAG: ABC transporter ATP-binding protein [Thermodesulfobacteriota bacterium]